MKQIFVFILAIVFAYSGCAATIEIVPLCIGFGVGAVCGAGSTVIVMNAMEKPRTNIVNNYYNETNVTIVYQTQSSWNGNINVNMIDTKGKAKTKIIAIQDWTNIIFGTQSEYTNWQTNMFFRPIIKRGK